MTTKPMGDGDVRVLIVGAGPVGLTAFIILSSLGIECALVEKHLGVSPFPKGRQIAARTVEIFRQYGLESALNQVAIPSTGANFSYLGETLTSNSYVRRGKADYDPYLGLSPATRIICSQEILEKILRTQAMARNPSHARFGHELIDLQNTETGCRALIRTKRNEYVVRSDFVISADGANSSIRERLGIRMLGPGNVRRMTSIFFRANLRSQVKDRLSIMYHVENDHIKGAFAVVNNDDRWLFMFDHRANDFDERDLNQEKCLQLLELAIGTKELSIEILGRRSWWSRAELAEDYRIGNIFLAGDAAHVMPPLGGHGMNCGVQDVHNIAWKLAGVIDGWASIAALETYESERRPVAKWYLSTILEAMSRPAARKPADVGMVLGYSYDSSIIIPDGTSEPHIEKPQSEYVPTARPGHRAPHVWLRDGGKTVSTLDQFGSSLVLLTGTDNEVGRRLFERSAESLGIPIKVHTIGGSGADLKDPAGLWSETFAVDSQRGMVLIRPDGFVAWRHSGTSQASYSARDVLLRSVGRSAVS